MAMILLEGITKSFNESVVLKDISMEFDEGMTHGLIGPNGCGKSVLMQIIAGLMRPDAGKVCVAGKRIGKDVDYPDDTGILINGPAFIESYSARRNLRLLAAYKHRIGWDEIDAAIEMVGLDPKSRKKVGKYSTGMKARLGIAQAIMEKPKLLILDEPFNGLDRKGVEEMYSVLQDMKKNGMTILISSHMKENIDVLCDRVYEISDGTAQRIV